MLFGTNSFYALWLAAVSVGSFAQNSPTVEATQKALAKIEAKNSFVDDLFKALSTRVSLPVGVKRVFNETEVVIAVDKVKFRKEYTEFSAFVRMKTPCKNKNRNSVQRQLILDSQRKLQTGNTHSSTYASLDYNGFRELGLYVDFLFSKKVVNSLEAKDSALRVNFLTVVGSINDIVANIDLPRFEIVGLDEFELEANQVSCDFSNLRRVANGWRHKKSRRLWPNQCFYRDKKGTYFETQNMLINNDRITRLFSGNTPNESRYNDYLFGTPPSKYKKYET